MTLQQLKKVERILAKSEYTLDEILANYGFTLQEYQDIKSASMSMELPSMLADIKDRTKPPPEIRNWTAEELTALVDARAKLAVPPPQITNQIVKETIVREPQIIKETKVEKITQNIPYDDKELRGKIEGLAETVDGIEVFTPADLQNLRDKLETEFGRRLQQNIDLLGMPDFRKLAMGLQGQIDALRSSGVTSSGSGYQIPTSGTVDGTNKDFVWATAPNSITVDGQNTMRRVSADGTVNWTLAGTTTSLTIAPNNDIFSNS